jgi:cell division protease FtsH
MRGSLSYDSSTQDSERVRFSDVAGIDEARDELVEVVDYLKNPKRYAHLGAKIPKGVLLVGPPGTGKTLLARAVAGEAGVPFFSISGSEFVEMFVGVGAARVRELFSQATEKAPCIIFIDEIDAIGRSRGGHGAFGTHEEREQTLNQLLTEMDGFDSSKGVVILAATNRPEVLDQALVRSGRFDRQVVVDAPDVSGRKAILEVHARKVPLGDDVDLQTVAKRTPGMVGADLAKVVNEAALAAARRGTEQVGQKDFEEAIDRIQLGLKRKGRAMSDEEKERVAYHESGHTIVAMSVERADPVHRVTIIPRSIGALGATLQLPSEDRYLVTKKELEDRICVMLGGRAAEEIVFNEVSTGAQNDIERATETARQMICRFGMSEKLGPQTFGQPAGLRFLESPASLGAHRNFSEARAQEIDLEVDTVVREQYKRARALLEERHTVLRAMALELLERETLERPDLERLVKTRPVSPPSSQEAVRAS